MSRSQNQLIHEIRRRFNPVVALERLESRELLAGNITFQGGLLDILGTGGNDSIQSFVASPGLIELQTNFGNQTISRAELVAVHVQVDAGDDAVDLRGLPRRVAVIVDGGIDDDTIACRSGHDVLIGGDGVDRLFGNGGADLLIGGSVTTGLSAVSDAWQDAVADGNLAAVTAQIVVVDDVLVDRLTGGKAADLFFAARGDLFLDRQALDDVTAIPGGTALDEYIQSELTSYHLAGVGAAVVHGTDLVWANGLGAGNMENGQIVTADTPFMLASISKTVTAVAVMQAVELGLLNLDADVDTYLPFIVRNPHFPNQPITVRMLMTHTSSIRDNNPFPDIAYSDGDSPVALGYVMEEYLSAGGQYYRGGNYLWNEPGSRYDYSNIGAALLGYLVEVTAGQPFDQFCQQHIFQPLGMTNTSWKMAGLDPAVVAMPYEYEGHGEYYAFGHFGFPDYPDGQLRSSVTDMSRFLRAFMADGELDGVRILQAASVIEMRRVQAPDVEPTQGLIWYFEQVGNHDVMIGHTGGESGVATFMFYEPSSQIGVLVFTNTTAANSGLDGRQWYAIERIADELFATVT